MWTEVLPSDQKKSTKSPQNCILTRNNEQVPWRKVLNLYFFQQNLKSQRLFPSLHTDRSTLQTIRGDEHVPWKMYKNTLSYNFIWGYAVGADRSASIQNQLGVAPALSIRQTALNRDHAARICSRLIIRFRFIRPHLDGNLFPVHA